jgi:hypothetical protein
MIMPDSLPYILICIFLVLILLVLLVGIYNYNLLEDIFKRLNIQTSNNYMRYISDENRQTVLQKDLTSDLFKDHEKSPYGTEKISIADTYEKGGIKRNETVKKSSGEDRKIFEKEKVIHDGEKVYGKGSNIKDFDFHSYGEFVSDEEKTYRISLIRNLKIKTIVVNSVTKGNGISQEYYRIAYKTNMIPAKILDVIVESKEFRELIPAKYKTEEFSIKGFQKGEFVQFKNTDMLRLLDEWSIGRLTPVSKAWKVKAEK